jgi:hypothetical protein
MSDYTEEVEATEENTNPTSDAPEVESSLHISKENITYRTYGTFDDKGLPTDTAVRRQSADGKTWEALEAAGKTRLVENTFVWYTLLDEAGFAELILDPEQRLAIINKGLNSIQTAAANQTQADFDKDSNQYVTNEQTIDLRDVLNEPIQKRNLSPVQKMQGMIKSLSADQIALLMAQLQAQAAGV